MPTGKFLWPGFGENMRVLKWIVDRAHGRAPGRGNAHRLDAAITRISSGAAWISPRRSSTQLQLSIAPPGAQEVIGHEELFIDLHDHLPPEMVYERELLICRLR